MRIAKIKDGRYAKVLSPQFTGLIGRLYEEINDRKSESAKLVDSVQKQSEKADSVAGRIAAIAIRYGEMDSMLKRLFPPGEAKAYLDRSLEVDGSVQADAFISTVTEFPPISVESSLLVKKLNAEYLSGKTAEDFQGEIAAQAEINNTYVNTRLTELQQALPGQYAPKSHVNQGGPGVHPYATETVAGFMSDTDKLKMNKFSISTTAPLNPTLKHVWVDIN